MTSLGLCIPTNNRLDLLEQCLRNCIKSVENIDFDFNCDICIIDNACDPRVERLVEEYKKVFDNLKYFCIKEKGYSVVRNECLRLLNYFNWDYITFIDDDEYPCVEWLNSLLKTAVNNNADIVLGPVEPVYSDDAPSWMKEVRYHGKFLNANMINNLSVNYFRTDNVLIRSSIIGNTQFDMNFNELGSEDYKFFNDLGKKKKLNLQWSQNALTFEIIPLNRTKLSYLLRRSYNGGKANAVFVHSITNNYIFNSITLLSQGAFNIIKGSFKYFISLFQDKEKQYRSLCIIARGFGRIRNIFVEYKE